MKTAYYFFLLAAPACAQVAFEKIPGRIAVNIGGKPYTTLFCGPETPKPYLHPLRSASGKIVTRRYPMENVTGESHDHPHHRGLWFGHGSVNGFDFWSNEPSQHGGKNARIVLKNVGSLTGGRESGAMTVTFDWMDPRGQTLLTETRTMTFRAESNRRIIDFDITLSPAAKVTFGDTKEGTFAIRLAPSLEEPTRESPAVPKRTGLMVDSEGRSGEKQVWGHRAAWVDYAGEIDGEKLGIAILDNPSNPRYPAYWHSRSYGLFAVNIFGLHDFMNDKNADGSLTVEPGNSLHFRYRVIIHPGDAKAAGIAAEYQKYR